MVGVISGVDINLLGRASQSPDEKNSAANAIRQTFGISTVAAGTQDPTYRLEQLQKVVAAGQVVSGLTSITEKAVLVDANTTADIAMQVEYILNAPALTLLVNPNNMAITYGTLQQYSNRTRNGFVFERWGETQPTISFSGSTGAFMAAANANLLVPDQQETSSPSGLQFASKRDSAAFQNFTSLYQFYRNNGYIYDNFNRTRAHLMVGAVAIDYDQMTYVGHIESFDYSYQEDSPHRIEWSMEFTVDVMYDNATTPQAVLPLVSPQPSLSYPSRSGNRFFERPDSVSGGSSSVVNLSGNEDFAEEPVEFFAPSQILK